MQDLSGLTVPKMQVTEGFAVLPQEVMDSFSDKSRTDEAARMIGLPANAVEEAAGEGS